MCNQCTDCYVLTLRRGGYRVKIERNHKIYAVNKFLLTVYAISLYLYALVKNLTYFITMMKRILIALAALNLGLFSVTQAQIVVTNNTSPAALAQAFPNKAIRLVCPFPPGGAVDIASRAIALELAKNLGQPVTVDNKPGAGGNIGGAEVARANPDGYTIFMTTSGIQAINPALYAKMPFDPNKDLKPVTALVSLNNVPRFSTIRLGNDHTEGMRADRPSPYAHVADNDLAVGMLIDHLSKSPVWKESVV